jgi:hypothetical protein
MLHGKSRQDIAKLSTRIQLRYYRGGRMTASSDSATGDTATIHTLNQSASDTSREAAGLSNTAGTYQVAPDNDDILNNRLRRFVWRSKLVRFLRAVWFHWFPGKSAEDLRKLEKEKVLKAQQAHLMEQLKIARPRLINRLEQQGFCKISERQGRKFVDRVGLNIGRVNPNEIIFKVTHFPDGVDIPRMVDADTCTALSESVERPVSALYEKGKEKLGVRYYIALAGSDGLPSVYSISDMLKDFPTTAAALALPYGVRTNGLPFVVDLASAPHLLGAGSTGNGKTNMIHAFLCTLINRNGPAVLKLDLLDFKDQGLELSFYEGIPHLRTGKIINDPGEMKSYFASLTNEMTERYKLLKAKGKRKISEYNRRLSDGKRMPFLVVVVDEFASVVHELGQDDAERAIKKVAEQGRAVGIHLIVFTQYPLANVISSAVTSNMAERISFYLPKQEQSNVILNSPSAHSLLNNNQKGRAIVLHGGNEYIVQTPLVTDRQILQFVAAAKAGNKVENIGVGLDPEEIIRWAILFNFNKLGFRQVYEQFKPRGITQADLNSLLGSMDGQEFDIDGTSYIVKNLGGSAGRRVELLNGPDNLPNTGDESGASQNIIHKTQPAAIAEFRDALRATMAAWDVEYLPGDANDPVSVFNGDHLGVALDVLMLDPGQPRHDREQGFIGDVRALCARLNAAPVDGAFIIEGQRVAP